MRHPMEGYASWHHYSEAELTTKDMTVSQAARKANMACTIGFYRVWIDGKPMTGKAARAVVGKKLLTMGTQ